MDLSISHYSYGKEFNRTLITVKQFELLDAVMVFMLTLISVIIIIFPHHHRDQLKC